MRCIPTQTVYVFSVRLIIAVTLSPIIPIDNRLCSHRLFIYNQTDTSIAALALSSFIPADKTVQAGFSLRIREYIIAVTLSQFIAAYNRLCSYRFFIQNQTDTSNIIALTLSSLVQQPTWRTDRLESNIIAVYRRLFKQPTIYYRLCSNRFFI